MNPELRGYWMLVADRKWEFSVQWIQSADSVNTNMTKAVSGCLFLSLCQVVLTGLQCFK